MSTRIATRQPVILNLAPSAAVDAPPGGWPRTPRGSARRLLALLDRPRPAAGLDVLLRISQRRVNQIVIDLAALGHLRCAEPGRPTHFIATPDGRDRLMTLGCSQAVQITARAGHSACRRAPAGSVSPVGCR